MSCIPSLLLAAFLGLATLAMLIVVVAMLREFRRAP